MKSECIVVTGRGGPEVLQRAERDHTAGPGEILIQVMAAGVSYGDVLARAGVIPGGPKPPYVPGFDVTGTVVACGPGVTSVRVGQPVTALVREGAYCDLVAVPAERAVPLPAGLDPIVCAAGILNSFIAWQMLHRVAKVQRGSTILVHGAAGGVGLALVQLARLHGVEVLGTCSAAKAEIVAREGARPIDYETEDVLQVVRDVTQEGVAAAFDHIGGTHFLISYACLRSPGILVAYGQDRALRNGKKFMPAGVVGFLGGIIAPKLVPDGKSTTFYNAWSLETSEPLAYRADLARVMDLMARGRLRPILAGTVALESAADAHRALEGRTVRGKLVLVPGKAA
ncbi:MAG: zinc-binding dehydrogenase [Tetrasphaera sp.]